MYKIVCIVVFMLFLVGGVFSYNAPTFGFQPIIVESDSDFYGSSNGFVTIDLNLINPTNTNYDLYLNLTDLYAKGVTIKRLKINDTDFEVETGKLKSKTKLRVTKNKVNNGFIELNFDPQVIGIGQEFDIQLLNDAGQIVADLDPFLSSWDYRQEWTLNTDGISLAGNVTNDHVILFTKDETDAEFCANVDSNGNDVRFTNSANDLYDYHFESFGSCLMVAWVEVTETFDSSTDVTGYLYYGNSGASAVANVPATYPASYTAVYHLGEPSGTTGYDAKGTYDLTHANTPTLGSSGKIFTGVDYVSSNNEYSSNGTLLDSGYSSVTVSFWAKKPAQWDSGASSEGAMFIKQNNTDKDLITLVWRTDGRVQWKAGDTGSAFHVMYSTNDVWSAETWYNFIATYDSVGNVMNLYVNGSTTGGGTLSESMGVIGAGTLDQFMVNGRTTTADIPDETLDEFKVFQNTVLTSDEVKLLYNSDNNSLVSFGSQETSSIDPTFTDLNLFEFDDFTKNLNLNIGTDTNIVFDFNVSDDDLNNNSFLVYYQVVHAGDDSNCFSSVRTDYICGWKKESLLWDLVGSTTDWNNFRSENEDDHAFKHSAYNLDPEDFETKGTPILLNSGGAWLKTLITNARHIGQGTDSNVFFNFSFSANFIGQPKNLELYDCNQDVADPSADSVNCNNLAFASSNPKEKDTYYSIFRASNDLNQVGANNVTLNSDGNHHIYANCTNCSAGNRWEIDAVDTNSNIDRVRNWTSTTGVANLVASVKTADFHIHYQSLLEDHNFNWLVQVSDSNGNDFNSSIYTDVIEAVNVEPEIVRIDNPILLSIVSGNIDINAFVEDPNNDDLNCDIVLYNSDSLVEVVIESEKIVIGNNCNTYFDTSTVTDGNYFVGIVLRESLTAERFFSDLNQDNFFVIDNDAPAVSVSDPDGNFDSRTVINVEWTITDPFWTDFYIDLNYSATNSQGTGTVVLSSELISSSADVVCSGSYSGGGTCNYDIDLSGVSDGNYFVLIAVTNNLTGFGASPEFTIYLGTEPIAPTSDVNYIKRYVNPSYDQRDENIYYNPNTAYKLSDSEKQNIYLEQVTLILLVIGVIIVIGVLLLWKRK